MREDSTMRLRVIGLIVTLTLALGLLLVPLTAEAQPRGKIPDSIGFSGKTLRSSQYS